MSADLTPYALRQKIRSGEHTSNTSGLCTGFVQANVVILPKDWAQDFLMFAQSNPKPCPVIAVAPEAGAYHLPEAGKDFDIRSDVPQYRIWNDGVMTDEVTDIKDYWRDDLVTFLIGCSFSFEEALIADGLEIRNIAEGVNVPMYRTNVACKPAGRFSGNTVVSMRPFKPADAIRMIQICSRFPSVHGAPIHFGDPAAIGIADINKTDFGDPVTIKAGEVPVFTACGVTPQEAIAQAKPPFCITHSPGCMVVTDMPNSKLAIM
ncbi:putative hydro-lyase [Dasania sp. GY-MA-18]|uniref:Putative hydro-lyase O0V09_12745 n=1 Tax=Dasania phycosphaerae TaxID=2950436 RepID=A0A9J6RP39_9GAMM|nr:MULTISPECIES: putative hydro-lyase [Dasania]MCR8923639.1 putative hydro-lyase [Dasania sp. GY-MA-18]MCZ0866073.1 putative hydro-lyase [Dasania phycosphaerae]MCZ0869797.1 putative hydro-lyase [Dasania phycosphaerae]